MLRIIAGELKGRQIEVPEKGTKPITDRIKTSIFDLIRDFIPAATILDLFSGSGNFGIEAISRGAAKAVLVDSGDIQTEIIKKNIKHLEISTKCNVFKRDVFIFLKQTTDIYDIIMLDPPFPFSEKKKQELLDISLPRLSSSGVLVFRYPSNEKFTIKEDLVYEEAYQQKYGVSVVSFFKKIL